MNLAIDPAVLVAFLLVMTRLMAAFVSAPPFAGVLVPVRVRVALAVAVALVVAPTQHADVRLDIGPLVVALVYQVVVGGLFGYLVQLVLSAPLVAGALVDNLTGFSAASLFDPFSTSSTTPAARLNQLVATMILILLEGHLLVIRGVLRTYEAAPLGGLRVDSLRTVLADGVGQLMLAALEVGLPLLVALLMAELVLAMAARAAPQLNVMVVGFALKSLVFTIGFTVGLPLLVNASSGLLDRGLRWAVQVGGG